MKTIPLNINRYSRLADEDLLQLVLAGEESACTVLVHRYDRLLHFTLQSYLPDHDARQEVIQDTFIRAFRALPGFRGECKFSTWLTKIARTTAISRLRLRRYDAWDSIEDTLSHWETDLEASVVDYEKQETNQVLRSVVQQLNPNDAKALDLFYFREHSFEEIEKLTGWTSNNIKSRLFRARQRLHAVMQKEGLQAEYFA